MNKKETIKHFLLNKTQIEKIEFFINSITTYNNHTNLIGKSTIVSFWNRHISDCLQLTKYINNKKSKILDMGTGAGLPGILISIIGYQNVTMVDSVKKKTDFINKIIEDLSLTAKVKNNRIEKTKLKKQDIIVSRALAPLKELLTYTRMHSNINTTSLFLKGRSVNNEIEKAMKKFSFDFKKFKSVSSHDGCILQIKNIKIKNV